MPAGVNLYTEFGADAVFEAIANLSTDIAAQVNTPGSAIRTALDALYAAASSSGSQILVGTGAPAGSLGNLQDFYVDTASGDYYKKTTSTSWALQGNLRGPAGAAGSGWQVTAGVPGAGVGANGDYALNGSTGDIYGPKTSGAWGSIVANIKGGAGANGNTVLNGSGVPSGGNNGDFWIDTTNWRIYGPKAAGAWPGTYTSLIGATGAAGNTVLNGAGAPSGGNNGDFWIDTTNNRLYGPKAAGAWPGTYVGLVGPPGPIATTITANRQTGTTYTLVLGDAGEVVEMNNASANTLTVPTNATVAYGAGTVIQVLQYGAGQTTVAPAGGVTIRYASSLTTRARYSTLVLRYIGSDEWVCSGDAT